MLRARVVVALALVSALLGCSSGKRPESQAWSMATGAEAFERLWWKAIQTGDYKTAERHLAPIYTLTTTTGILGRDQAVSYYQSRGISGVNISGMEVRPQGPDMVVSYTADLQTAKDSSPQRYYMTTVWQQIPHGWFAIAHSETPAAAAQTSTQP